MKVQNGEAVLTKTPVDVLSYFSLFTSLGTLLCCALPSLLVLLGLGATVATVLASVPWLVTLSHHKVWVFTVAGVLIALNFIQTYAVGPRLRSNNESCPPESPVACDAATRVSKAVLWIATAIYALGFFVAYVLGPILLRLDRA
jgi:mercuric ion transport protein